MDILATRDHAWLHQCEAALLAEGVVFRWLPDDGGRVWVLDVPVSDAERAGVALAELLGEDLHRVEQVPVPLPSAPLLLQPAFAVAACLAVLLLAFFVVTGPSAGGSWWFIRGALVTTRAMAGEWWRVITAATLHANAAHAMGNAAFMWVLGWALAERVGGGVMLGVCVATAVAGFGASLLFSDATVTVGASGGLFGLLGASGGHGLKTAAQSQERFRPRLRMLGAAVMLFAFTAFSPKANIEAHVGGFVSGLGAGLLLPEGVLAPRWQLAAASMAVGVVALGWYLAAAR